MSEEFKVQILTPARELITTTASEVLLPSQKGEIGILPLHEDICGLLSTGTLKLVSSGNDFWFMVSGGAYQVDQGTLTILAEYALGAESVATEQTLARLKEVEKEIAPYLDTRDQNHITLSLERDRLSASIEANRRHTMS